MPVYNSVWNSVKFLSYGYNAIKTTGITLVMKELLLKILKRLYNMKVN